MKKNYLKLCATVFALAIVTASFTGCFSCSSPKSKKHIAAIIRPTTEELTAERLKLEQYVEKKAKEADEVEKQTRGIYVFTYEQLMKKYGFTTVGDVQLFYDEIEAVISSRKDFRLVDRGRTNDVLKEHEFSLSSFSDSNKVAEIGKALNCDTLIYFESDRPFPIQNPSKVIQTVRVEFFDVNTFSKKVVVVNKPLGGSAKSAHPFMWGKSKKALRKVDID